MPGPFTHIAICQSGMSQQDEPLGEELTQLLEGYCQFVFWGAVSPDLPYLSIDLDGRAWCDALHDPNNRSQTKTNSLVISGFEALRHTWPHRTPADEIKYAWLMGYVSHMVADATIHPIVQAIVGPYEGNETAHRICEMTMDSLIFE